MIDFIKQLLLKKFEAKKSLRVTPICINLALTTSKRFIHIKKVHTSTDNIFNDLIRPNVEFNEKIIVAKRSRNLNKQNPCNYFM